MRAIKSDRAFELDALRGLALFMMVLHHLILDLRSLLELPVCAFQERWWSIYALRPLFLNVFLVVSGISCTFSRSNTRRGLRLLLLAHSLTAASALVSWLSSSSFYVFFNVLHVLAVGILSYALLNRREQRGVRDDPRTDVLLTLLTALLIWGASLLHLAEDAGSWWLLPLGLPPDMAFDMADYMPIVPWLGFFFAGTLIGRRVYREKRSAFPGAPAWLLKATRPFSFMGRHSLVIYVLHQPVLVVLLYGLRTAGVL